MQITFRSLILTKRYPLTISRGTQASSHNLLVQVEHEGVTGMGECSPVSETQPPANAQTAEIALSQLAGEILSFTPWDRQRIEEIVKSAGVGRVAYCALDMALFDWMGKRLGAPVHRLLGANLACIAPTSLTIGINPPDVVRERVAEIVARLSPRALKFKLGCPDGIEADQAMLAAGLANVPAGVAVRVDANGGWKTVANARKMMAWLAKCGVEYVEQPFALGEEDKLPEIYQGRPLPIFADESCWVASDVPPLAGRVDGVNLKLMKAGGIGEGLRVIHAARAHGLSVMMGCMSESSLAIAASAAISPFADHLDLDSHLNLIDDPFEGVTWRDGRVLPSDRPGLGVSEHV